MHSIFSNISVVVPYKNESKGIVKTLADLANQTFAPCEVLLVNSQSTDNTFQVIEKWRTDNFDLLNEKKIILHNLSVGTNSPASSKNVGIKKATGKYIALMDCGLNFQRNWLETQYEKLIASKSEIIFGTCLYQGKGLWDSCAVALTSGINAQIPCNPGTLCEKTIFEKYGFFLENRRSGYDIEWRMKLKSFGVNSIINNEVFVTQRSYNFAPTLWTILNKCYVYSLPTVGLVYFKTGRQYWALLVVLVVSILISLQLFIAVAVLYGIFRSYIWTYYKSKNFRLFKDFPSAVLFLPLVAIIVDTGRITGLFVGYLNYYLRGIKFNNTSDVVDI